MSNIENDQICPKNVGNVSVSSDLDAWVILAISVAFCTFLAKAIALIQFWVKVKTGIFDCGLRFKSICILEVLLSSKASRYAECTFAFLLLKASTLWDFRLGFIYFRRNTNSQTRAPQSFLFPSPADDLIRKAPILSVSSLQTPAKSLR